MRLLAPVPTQSGLLEDGLGVQEWMGAPCPAVFAERAESGVEAQGGGGGRASCRSGVHARDRYLHSAPNAWLWVTDRWGASTPVLASLDQGGVRAETSITSHAP